MVILSLPLKKPLKLKRRALSSADPYTYQAEFVSISNRFGLTGYGEVIGSQNLAEELAYLHLGLLEANFEFKFFHKTIPIAGMIDNLKPEALAEACELVSLGFKTLKFKVGNHWALEAETLHEIRLKIGPQIDIRLDANRAFDFGDAVAFGKRVADLRIAYFEEPLRDISKIPGFVQATGIPVALDETLPEGAPAIEGVSTYALKPFLMPSLNHIFECLQLAKDRGIDIAICSAFESPHSLNWLVLLAAMTHGKLLPAGLSTYRWFEGHALQSEFSASAALENLKAKITPHAL